MKFDFEHYLKAGHGRAYLIAKEDPGKYREAILNACRKDYTFDMQCEGSRAFLTADLVSLFDDPEPFIKAAIESFASTKIDNVTDEIQYLSDLLMEFDQRRIVLRKYLDLWKTVKNTPYEELEEDYIQLRFNLQYLAIKLVNNHSWKVAEKIATDIGEWYISLGDDAESEFIWFYSTLEKQYGEEETREHLLKLSETSPEIKAFCNNDLEYSKDFGKKITRKKNKLTASEVIVELKADPNLKGIAILRLGVRNMEDQEIIELAKAAENADSTVLRTQIVSVFNTPRFAWPLDPGLLLKWSSEGDEELRAACHSALAEVAGDGIREYARKNLENGFDADCLSMLIRNYDPSDESYILSMLESIPIEEENEGVWHGIGHVICDLHKTLPVSFLMWVYNTTLCSCCREYTIEDLIERGELTDVMRNECMWDANLDIRELVEEKI
ncbi:MAG: hypothetical protein J6T40_01350 [Clostridiales bacterium]|nr:hypothetical protein [Clostridiales bacterium]